VELKSVEAGSFVGVLVCFLDPLGNEWRERREREREGLAVC